MYILIEDDALLKIYIYILIMEIKLAVVSNKNLIWNPSRIKHYWQLKGKSYSDQAADFNDKKWLKKAILLFV